MSCSLRENFNSIDKFHSLMSIPMSSALPPSKPSLEDIKADVSLRIVTLDDNALVLAEAYQADAVKFFQFCLSVSRKEMKRRKLSAHAQ